MSALDLTSCQTVVNFPKEECQILCGDNENACLQGVKNYCFNTNQPLQSRFFTGDPLCEGWITNAYSKTLSNTNTILETTLVSMCNTLYTEGIVTPEFMSSGTSDSNINEIVKSNLIKACSCRLPDSVYTNFKNQLIQTRPGLANLASGNFACLFPNCATTPLRPYSTREFTNCPNQTCINLLNVSNTGIFQNVIINSENQNCVFLRTDASTPPLTRTPSPTTTPLPTRTASPLPSKLNLTLILAITIPIGIIVILILIYIIYYFTKSKSKK
jgi:hypothetical protein